jgi:hypothetical protein
MMFRVPSMEMEEVPLEPTATEDVNGNGNGTVGDTKIDFDEFLNVDTKLELLKGDFDDLCMVAETCKKLENIDGKLFSITALGVALTNLVLFVTFFNNETAGTIGFPIVITLLCLAILFAFGGLTCEWIYKRNSVAYNKGVVEMKNRLGLLKDTQDTNGNLVHYHRLANVFEHYKGYPSNYAPHAKIKADTHTKPYEEVGQPATHNFHKLHKWWSNADSRSRYTVYELRQWGVALRRWVLAMKVNIALSIVCQGASQALISSISSQ